APRGDAMQAQVLDGRVQAVPLVEDGDHKSRCSPCIQATISAASNGPFAGRRVVGDAASQDMPLPGASCRAMRTALWRGSIADIWFAPAFLGATIARNGPWEDAMAEQKRWKKRPENSTWGDYGPDDQLGRMNELTPAKVKQGIAEVKEGK